MKGKIDSNGWLRIERSGKEKLIVDLQRMWTRGVGRFTNSAIWWNST